MLPSNIVPTPFREGGNSSKAGVLTFSAAVFTAVPKSQLRDSTGLPIMKMGHQFRHYVPPSGARTPWIGLKRIRLLDESVANGRICVKEQEKSGFFVWLTQATAVL